MHLASFLHWPFFPNKSASETGGSPCVRWTLRISAWKPPGVDVWSRRWSLGRSHWTDEVVWTGWHRGVCLVLDQEYRQNLMNRRGRNLSETRKRGCFQVFCNLEHWIGSEMVTGHCAFTTRVADKHREREREVHPHSHRHLHATHTQTQPQQKLIHGYIGP